MRAYAGEQEGNVGIHEIEVNGRLRRVDVDDDTPLLWVLRDELGLTGSKYGCGVAACGACTVHLDDQPICSCITAIAAVAGRRITTIEGVRSRVALAVKAAWAELDVVQCGYCQSGQIMSAIALLERNAVPDRTDIDTAMRGNLCRCATYQRIRDAILLAARMLARDTR